MQDNLSSDLKTLVASERGRGKTVRSDTLTDTAISDLTLGQKLTVFGHTFTLAELDSISRFASRLEIAADSLVGQQQILDGSIFILKVLNQQAQVSFGGISKK
jgi:hypothetical protein